MMAAIHDNIELLIWIIAGLTYILNEVRKEYNLYKSNKHSTVEHDDHINAKIFPTLWHLVVRFNASRCYIIQYHNGDTFYTGQSIQRMSISHEVVNPHYDDAMSVKESNQNVTISNRMHHIQNQIITTGKYKIDTIWQLEDIKGINEYVQQQLIGWMKMYRIGSLLYLKISNNKNQLIAILCMEWPHEKPITAVDESYICEYKQRIETIFNNL
jgi:hypothetical protein